MANLADQELSIPRGSGAVIRLAITNEAGVAQDLAAANSIVIFTAKRKKSDAAALFQKSYVVGPAVLPAGVAAGGIVRNGAVGVNIADVSILPADTRALADSAILVWDAWYYPPGGQPVPVAKGTIRVGALPYTP